MNPFSKFALLILIYLEIFLLLAFLPLIFVFRKDTIKNIFHEIKIYDRIILVSKEKTLEIIKSDDSFFYQVLSQNFEKIITPEFISLTSNQFIDEIFNSLKTSQQPRLIVSTQSIRDKYIFYLQQSHVDDIGQNLDQINAQITEEINLQEILNISDKDILDILFTGRKIIQSVKMFLITITILLLATISCGLVFFEKLKFLSLLNFSSFLVSISYIGLFLFSKLYLLSDQGLQSIIKQTDSVFIVLIKIIGLTFLEKISFYWSWLALIMFTLSSVVFLIKLIKSSK